MGFLRRTEFEWGLKTRTMALGKQTKVMGILNVTPDSFSDGGQFVGIGEAVERGVAMLDAGAHIVDVGGESTRPGATTLEAGEEQARVLPVIEGIVRERPEAIVSVDTYHAATARRAVAVGAEIVNDVSGMTWDPGMASTCAELACGVVLMHTRGRPQDWAGQPAIPPMLVMPTVLTGLRDALLEVRRAGIEIGRIVLDPGFGFGKAGDENYVILALMEQMRQFGLPVLAGLSRKGFLGKTLAPLYSGESAPAGARLHATTAGNVAAILAGAHIVRVHDVRAAVEAAAIADAVLAQVEAQTV